MKYPPDSLLPNSQTQAIKGLMLKSEQAVENPSIREGYLWELINRVKKKQKETVILLTKKKHYGVQNNISYILFMVGFCLGLFGISPFCQANFIIATYFIILAIYIKPNV